MDILMLGMCLSLCITLNRETDKYCGMDICQVFDIIGHHAAAKLSCGEDTVAHAASNCCNHNSRANALSTGVPYHKLDAALFML